MKKSKKQTRASKSADQANSSIKEKGSSYRFGKLKRIKIREVYAHAFPGGGYSA